MTAAHTPGPWMVDRTVAIGAYGVWTDYATHPGHDEAGYPSQICSVYTESDAIHREQRDANAKLIAAAPDMLAALKALLPCTFCHDKMDCKGDCGHCTAIKASCAAIAKATGKESTPTSCPDCGGAHGGTDALFVALTCRDRLAEQLALVRAELAGLRTENAALRSLVSDMTPSACHALHPASPHYRGGRECGRCVYCRAKAILSRRAPEPGIDLAELEKASRPDTEQPHSS